MMMEALKETYSFNVNFVNQKLSSFSATCSVRHNDMPNSQNIRTHEQNVKTSIYTRKAKHIRSFKGHKNQRQNRAHGCDPQVRSSRKSRSITQTINTYQIKIIKIRNRANRVLLSIQNCTKKLKIIIVCIYTHRVWQMILRWRGGEYQSGSSENRSCGNGKREFGERKKEGK